MINTIADFIVATVRAGHRSRTWLSGVALVATFVFASAYLLVGILRLGTVDSGYRVSVHLAKSGGLIPGQDVTVRGVPVGRVESVTPSATGPIAVARIEGGVQISATAPVRVSGLSPAGEQYIDFAPNTSAGPYLSDGSSVALRQTTTPVSLATVLAESDGVLAQLDPRKLAMIKSELSLSTEGPRKLANIVDGGMFLLSTLDEVLPETVSVVKNSRLTLSTFASMNRGLGDSAKSLGRSLGGIALMDGGFRTLVDRTPGVLGTIDNVFADNSDTMVQLLGNLTTVSELTYVRIPALNALFPSSRGSVLEALSGIIRDQGVWATVDIYPRYSCDYGTPRIPPSSAAYPEPYLNAGYCRDDDPAVLIRGAKNAPRPAGDDTSGPPSGADLGAVSSPTPKGRFTIPTPYGGPTLPIEPPSR